MAEMRGVEHADHDLERIARVAAGDGTAADDRAAAGLRAACTECSRLDADLRALASGLRALGRASAPAPAPRDFRLTPADAARLRPAGLRGLFGGVVLGVAGFGRAAVQGRIGGALVAIGIIGVLIGSGLPGGTSAGGAAFGGVGGASGPEANDQKATASAAAVFGPLQSRLEQATPTDRARATGPDAGGSPGIGSGPVIVVISMGAILVGFARLLAARGGRRAGP